MRYVISTGSAPDQVLLEARRGFERVLMILLFVIAPFVLLVSLGAFLGDEIVMGVSAAGFGAFLLSVAVILARMKPAPRLVFDVGSRKLWIYSVEPQCEAESIPFAELAGFAVIPRTYDQSVTYQVALVRRDAAVWVLMQSSKEEAAQALRQELARRVPLVIMSVEELGKGEARSEIPEGESQGSRPVSVVPFRVTEQRGTTRVEWQPRGVLAGALLAIFCVASFGAGFVGCLATTASRTGTIVGIGVAVLLLALIAYYALRSPRIEAIEVTETALRYRHGGRLPLPGRFTKPLAEVRAIQLYYAGVSTEPLLYVLGEAEVEAFKKAYLGTPSLGDLLEITKATFASAKIRLAGLDLVQMIRLERLLEEVIYRRSGRRGL